MLNKLIALSTVTAASLLATLSASASIDGGYIGGQLGYGYTHQFVDIQNQYGFDKDDFRDHGVAGGFLAGYQFNKNFAAEIGYTHFHNATIKNTEGEIRTQAVDFVGKGILPLDNNFSAFGKLGFAYINEKANNGYESASVDRIYPTFGLGVNYDINTNVSTDLSWTHIQKIGANNDALRNTDFFGLGLTYHFG